MKIELDDEQLESLLEGDYVEVEGVIEDIQKQVDKNKSNKQLDSRYLISRYLAAYHETNDSIEDVDESLKKTFHDYRQISYWQGQSDKSLCEELHQIIYDSGPEQYIEVGELLIEIGQHEDGKHWQELFLHTEEHSH